MIYLYIDLIKVESKLMVDKEPSDNDVRLIAEGDLLIFNLNSIDSEELNEDGEWKEIKKEYR